MPVVLREYNVGDMVWFVDVRDKSLQYGEVISASIHAFATLDGASTRVTYKIYNEDDYFAILQEHVASTPEEAAAILESQLDSYEC